MAQQLVVRLAEAKRAPTDSLQTADEAYRWLCGKGFRDCRTGEAPKDDSTDARPIDWSRVYDVLFAEYYKAPDHAREIFSEFVEQSDGRINWAHLCLGELVKQQLVSTVLTTNFDQLALAGLVRSGVLPVVCDGTESLTRIRGAPLHPQLIELHGSRHTYRLRNAPEDVQELISDTAAIAAIESLFQELHVFVAVGYGGREKGVMELLIKAASRFTDKQLYWVVHGSDPGRLSDNARRLLATSRNAAVVLDQDADSFFVRLLKELGVGAPEAMREPLFLADLNAARLAPHDTKDIADGSVIVDEIKRHRDEIDILKTALQHHRKQRTETEKAIVEARERRLAGKLGDAFQILLKASKRSNDLGFWRQFAEVAGDYGKHHPEIEPLKIAITAWRRVLAMDDSPQDSLGRGAILHELGTALLNLGARESDAANLIEAVVVYRNALKVRTRERGSLDWATTQNNLGIALRTLGERESGTARLDEAVAAYREALKEWTRERVPLDWALTQNNLGNALWTLGERESGTARFDEAVAAYREALKEYTRERVPLDWAMTQNNLGNALWRLGERESGAVQLNEAVTAYREALKEYTREREPLEWALTQNNLGNALSTLGEREGDIARLDEAVAAFREALKERTRERVPLEWALTQNNLGNVLWTLGEHESGTARLNEAVLAYQRALEVLVPARANFFIEMARTNLTRVEAIIAERKSKPK